MTAPLTTRGIIVEQHMRDVERGWAEDTSVNDGTLTVNEAVAKVREVKDVAAALQRGDTVDLKALDGIMHALSLIRKYYAHSFNLN